MSTSKSAQVENKTAKSDAIWDEIKDKTLSLYALPGQKVSTHVEKLPVPGDKLLVKLKSPAVLPALEEVLGDGFILTPNEKFIVVEKVESEFNI